jgi:hypothetical protein
MFRLTASLIVKYLTLIPLVSTFIYAMYVQVTFSRVESYRRKLDNQSGRRTQSPTEASTEETEVDVSEDGSIGEPRSTQ